MFIQGKPGSRAINRLHPLGQQSRFAKAGRSAHQDNLAAESRIQAFNEASPGNDVAATTWSVEFRAHQGVKRASSGCRLSERRSIVSGREPGGRPDGRVLTCESSSSSLQI